MSEQYKTKYDAMVNNQNNAYVHKEMTQEEKDAVLKKEAAKGKLRLYRPEGGGGDK